MSENPKRVIEDTTVQTRDKHYKASSVEMYPNYVHIYTKRDQANTDPEVWVPLDNVVEIGAEHSDPSY